LLSLSLTEGIESLTSSASWLRLVLPLFCKVRKIWRSVSSNIKILNYLGMFQILVSNIRRDKKHSKLILAFFKDFTKIVEPE
jgi:hypothetical protein